MAKIVLGIGSSHGPMLSTPPDQWGLRVDADKENPEQWFRGDSYTYDELVDLRSESEFGAEANVEVWTEKHRACRAALDTLADVFAEAEVDVVVIFGNDQMEIFTEPLIPAISVWRGKEIPNYFPDEKYLSRLPVGIEVSVPGHVSPAGATNPGQQELADGIIAQAMSDDFDVAVLRSLPPHTNHIPHAFGFIYRQIMRDAPIPSVPVLFNTFYPPNQPSVQRCYSFGASVVRAIENWDSEARVALISSGGLSHFVIDEEVDRALFDTLEQQSIDPLAALGEDIYNAGTSEIKNWIPVAGAMATLGYKPTVVDYVPCYRSAAGTGIAMGFVYWRP
ncbi:protocatechuate 3,4-dioxygenase [Nocardia sienata]|uniref:DODA-type extradiol aromatic ring-opening family dioxygenase n=1 Tax=Nocardia sienata TaxID=248552 RepID=UPI0007A543B7|nr:protocatechuate 3,4-dioxygenase [Nocardia sienata]